MSEFEFENENPFAKLRKSAKMAPTRVNNKQYGGQKAKFTKAVEILEAAIADITETAGYVTTKHERDHIAKYLLQAEEAMEKIHEFIEMHGEHEAAQIEDNPDYVQDGPAFQIPDFPAKKFARMT